MSGPAPWLATYPADVLLFRELARDWVEGGEALGMTWSAATQDFFTGLFLSYADGAAEGACAISLDGFCMAGGPLPYTTPWGKAAAGWGTYVRPDARGRGLSRQLREIVVNRLRELGFRAIIGQVSSSNASGQASLHPFGWEILGTQGVALIDP